MALTRPRHDWHSLEESLAVIGVDDEEFERSAVAALRESLRRRPLDDPSRAFTAQEAAVLRRGGFALEPQRAGEADAGARTAARFALMLADARDSGEVAAALRVSPARIRQRAIERTLYAIRAGDEWRFPRWQFDPDTGREIRGLGRVLSALSPSLHPVAVARFLAEPCPDLEIDDEAVAPLLWLRAGGDPEPVATIAAAL